MVKVSNNKTLFLITKRILKADQKRNILAVVAISLTALLFTSLFTGTESMILTKRATEVRQFMSSSHAIAQDLTPEQGEKIEQAIKDRDDVERYGKGIFLGSAVNPELSFSVELRYADENMAESFNCAPTKGRLPEKENEIAVSSLVLDRLGIPHKLGQKVSITWEKWEEKGKSKTVTDEFTVTGYWEGDKAVLAQLLFVSEEYALKNCISPSEDYVENGYYCGTHEYAIWYRNLWKLRDKTQEINKVAGMDEERNNVQVNPAYDLMEEDSFSFGSLIMLVLFIVLCGYLIIYNVFSLSVRNDIRAYGLLKNIGTTGKQLKKIVRLQALILSLIGIPIGLVAGYLTGALMAPSLNADGNMDVQLSGDAVVHADVFIFAIAALLTLLTVYLSCLQSCKMVDKVSPVEALRLAENDTTHRGRIRNIKKEKSVKWFALAARNIVGEWKKGIIVMISIALAMIVANCTIMLVNGYDFEEYSKIFIASDFKIDQLTGTFDTCNFEGIDNNLKKVIEDCPYSSETGYVYYTPQKLKMDGNVRKNWNRFAAEYKQYWHDYENNEWKKVKDSGEIGVHLMGVNEAAFNKLEWRNKPCSWEEFCTGKYAIVDYNEAIEEPNSYYEIGSKTHMEFKEGAAKEYEILGEAKMPYSMDYPMADFLYITVILPEKEFINKTDIDGAMLCSIDAKDGQIEKVSEYIKKEVSNENDMLHITSILDMKESFSKYVNKYYFIGGILTAILLFIGVMNFFNVISTSIISRKRELGMLEAVGMTEKSIIWMLIAEGFIYFVGAFIIAALIICFASESILAHTIGKAFYFHMHLTLMPIAVMIPLFVLIAIIIPYRQYHIMCKESVVERINV